ncbi:KxYKxGKxW signal peptide domain-containing protein [Paucilactobacillus sp. N302-9]
MVGKNNYQKAVKANLQEHHKAYKVGKRWVYASISSLAFGSMLFFSGQLTSFADTTTADATANSTTSAAIADSSSVTLKTVASSAKNNSSAVTNQTAVASSSAATSSVAKTTLNNPTDSELAATKTSAAANYAVTA